MTVEEVRARRDELVRVVARQTAEELGWPRVRAEIVAI
jgi:hypothetical protein